MLIFPSDKPENTSLSINKSDDVLLINETIKLTCESSAKPKHCHVMFYHGDQLLANKSSKICSADHVIPVQGCNEESLWCIAVNDAGFGAKAYRNITVNGKYLVERFNYLYSSYHIEGVEIYQKGHLIMRTGSSYQEEPAFANGILKIYQESIN